MVEQTGVKQRGDPLGALLAFVFCVLMAAAVGGVFDLAGANFSVKEDKVPPFKVELFKSLLEFLMLGVGAIALTALIQRFADRRNEEAQAERTAIAEAAISQRAALAEAAATERAALERTAASDREARAIQAQEDRDAQAEAMRTEREARAEVEAEAQRKRDQDERDLAAVRDSWREIVSAYNKVKLARRLMRISLDTEAREERAELVMSDDGYRDACRLLLEGQLEFELLHKSAEAATAHRDHFRWMDAAATRLEICEGYLAGVLREFEFGSHGAHAGGGRSIGWSSDTFGFIFSKRYAEKKNKINEVSRAKALQAQVEFFDPIDELRDLAVGILSSPA